MTIPAADKLPIDWQLIEDAVHDWIVEEAALVPAFVWENQNVTQPPYPYASAKIIEGPTKEGGKDEPRVRNASGGQIEIVTVGPVAFTVALAFHLDKDSGAYDPARNARFLASKAQASLGQPRVIAFLSEAGLAVVRELGVQDTSVVVNGEWLSRATLDVRLRTTSAMVERHGYIDKAQIEFPGFIDTIVDAS